MQIAAETRPLTQPTVIRAPSSRAGRALALSRRAPRLLIFGRVILVMVFIGIFAPVLAPYDPYQTTPARTLEQPSLAHWLGTDNVGRDQLSRVLVGTRVSMAVAVIAVSISLGCGVAMGLAAGYIGGVVDQVLGRIIDATLAFPGVLLAIAITNALGPSLRNAMIAIGIIGIPLYFRLTRGQVLQLVFTSSARNVTARMPKRPFIFRATRSTLAWIMMRAIFSARCQSPRRKSYATRIDGSSPRCCRA